ncbi:hypothetical protein Pst134EA_011986 [Puccinia striiformis f. sp. tritici]|uniref:NADP-dependent oxidoreductase domain-containing protein n=1 Tax=Puccinia striiformis f. sp. tritici PST-78 TaxID=1165861 RepID=A0A0L0V3T6_9BASI|nr:hypothetical protein Pst134EA_011986 [Puccinia striiformis f. sp. tritici]KAH9468363.1 hypothetical protein Pst134EA_011986 [Puccinia striiformis f. sp. tritici]KNE93856.1 hypothetical protein PSTG_12769 [Puccinia striiformis f. sp. tritici PST-78]
MSFPETLSPDSYVTLNSGQRMPVVGFGLYKATDAGNSCREALKAGYTHIDSARHYANETAVGEVLRDSDCAKDRDSVFLTTKVKAPEHGYETCKNAVIDSVTFPKPDRWDLILLHDPTAGSQKRIEAYKALAEALKEGKTKSIGVSNFGVHHIEELVAANVGPLPAVNQVELHPWCQQRWIVDYCKSKGILIQAYCPIVRGKYMDHPTLVNICNKVGKTGAQVLIRWSLQHGFVPLPKSDKAERIQENFDVFSFELDEESMAQLDSLDQGDAGAISWNPTRVE